MEGGTHLPQCACAGVHGPLRGVSRFHSVAWVGVPLTTEHLTALLFPHLLPRPTPTPFIFAASMGRTLRHGTEPRLTESDSLPSTPPIKVKDTESKKTNEPTRLSHLRLHPFPPHVQNPFFQAWRQVDGVGAVSPFLSLSALSVPSLCCPGPQRLPPARPPPSSPTDSALARKELIISSPWGY